MPTPLEIMFPVQAALKASVKCPLCTKDPGPFRDELSSKEFKISGMCQTCQDNFFDESLSEED